MSDPTPDPYTSAAFRTDRDELGVSVDFLAQQLDLAAVTVWKYQSPMREDPIPERVRALMDKLQLARLELVAALADDDPAPLVRPRTEDEAAELYPALAGWGLHAVGLVLADARVLREGYTRIHWTTPNA